jgi:hypothetical protein
VLGPSERQLEFVREPCRTEVPGLVTQQDPLDDVGGEKRQRQQPAHIALRHTLTIGDGLKRRYLPGRQLLEPEAAARDAFSSAASLLRDWQGHTHEVLVVDQGFVWQQAQYRSLSQIARAITGTRWSGPAFFGLKPRTATARATPS